MTTLNETDRSVNTNIIWRQHFIVKGDSLRLLASVSNFCIRNTDNNRLILKGDGPYFPAMHGTSWAARCAPRLEGDVALSDLTPLLHVLLESTPIPMSAAPLGEVAEWLLAQESGR